MKKIVPAACLSAMLAWPAAAASYGAKDGEPSRIAVAAEASSWVRINGADGTPYATW